MKETPPPRFPKAGTAAALQERPVGKPPPVQAAGELERAGEWAPSPLVCETAAAALIGNCDGSRVLSATIKALER